MSPPVPQDAFKATKYEVGCKVKYIGSDGGSWHASYFHTTYLIIDQWHNGEIMKQESTENGKKYKVSQR